MLVDHESGALRVGGEAIVPVEAATACLEIKSSLAGNRIELALRKTTKLKSLERTNHKGFFWTNDQTQQSRIETPPRAPNVYLIAYDSPDLRGVLARVNQNPDWYERDYMRYGPDVITVLGQGFAFKNDHHIYSHPSSWDVVVNDAEPGLFTIIDHIQEYLRRYGNLTYEPW